MRVTKIGQKYQKLDIFECGNVHFGIFGGQQI